MRHHGEIARLEIAREELSLALTRAMFQEFTRIFKGLGFTFATVDTEGFFVLMNSSPSVQSLVYFSVGFRSPGIEIISTVSYFGRRSLWLVLPVYLMSFFCLLCVW